MKTSGFPLLCMGLLSMLTFSACQKSIKKDEDKKEETPVEKTEPLAGNGTAGFADGDLSTAMFNQPKGISLDASGNIFIADWGNERIRKIAASQVTTIAGSVVGYADGTGAAAKFDSPGDVAVDGQGNLYVADIDNDCIRKITPDGTVSTFAGTNSAGYKDGTGTAARFRSPRGVAADGQGNVYVADMSNNCIRKISPEGVVTTLAGNALAGYSDGTGAAASFNRPRDMAVDGAGNVYVVDSENNAIRKITPAGVVTTLAGGGTAGYSDGSGSAAKFRSPKGIAVDKNGVVYVADTDNNRIRKVTADGLVTTLAGTGTAGYAEGAGGTAKFNAPRSIALDATGKILFVVDQDNNRIRKIALL